MTITWVCERMLALRKSLKSTHNPQEADRLMREVESVDKTMDGLVASRELSPERDNNMG
ncbi:MAG: hypothetical protein Q7T89_02740 [Anaerolineales bacterium]|nr:hypothetical protein [Anaerolineales bacterium]